jgi:hypothetical protein
LILHSAEEKLVFKTMRSSAVVTLLAVALAACSEGPTAPTSPTFDISDPLMAKGSNGGNGGNGGGSSGSGGSNKGPGRGKDEGTRTFTIWPGFGVWEKFGDHTLYMPANVTCDPASSGYGSAFWDQPCARAKTPIQVTATWSVKGGRPVISFSPDLRFAPSNHERDWVKLSLRDPKETNAALYYAILWYDKKLGRWVDESVADPTLKARVEGEHLVSRRVKHFSDWLLWSGFGSYNVTSGLGGDMGWTW